MNLEVLAMHCSARNETVRNHGAKGENSEFPYFLARAVLQ
jgi:hypothetical protein